MRRIIVLAHPPHTAALQAALVKSAACVISLTPWLSAQLEDADIASRPVSDYAATEEWEDIHAELWRTLAATASDEPAPMPSWLHDWSHFLVDELRADLYWASVAKRIVERESPTEILIQRASPQCGSAGSLSALSAAFDLLGQHWSFWPQPRE